MALRPFQGWPTRRPADCSRLLPFLTPHAVRLWYFVNTRFENVSDGDGFVYTLVLFTFIRKRRLYARWRKGFRSVSRVRRPASMHCRLESSNFQIKFALYEQFPSSFLSQTEIGYITL
jgi:hypothetical protein